MLRKTSKILCLVSVALMLASITSVQSQENEQIIVISSKVGEIIDRQERDRYGIFPASQDFHSAVILQRPDSSYAVEITEECRGLRKVRTLPIDPSTLDRLKNRIDNFDQLSPAEKTEIRARYEAIREATTAEKAWIHYSHEGIRETTSVNSQWREKGQIIVISPKVGEIIDREERDYFGLFPASQNFHSAMIIKRPDGSYAVEITEDHEGRLETRLLPIGRKALELLRQRIEGILPRGESFRAQENPTIVITDSQLHQWEGRLLGMEADSVVIGPPQCLAGLETKRISILNVQSILLRKPTKIHQGIAGGCLFGGIFGAIGGLVAAESESGDYWTWVKIHSITGAAVYGAIGAVIGGVAGEVSGRDRLIDLSEKSREERIKILRQIAGLPVEYEEAK